MILYLTLALGVTFIAGLHQRRKPKEGNATSVWFYAVIAILGLFSSLRYGIGIDYSSYIWIFENIAQKNRTHTEFGFNIIVYLIRAIGLNNQWIFAFFSFLTAIITIGAYNQQSKKFSITVFFYMVMGFYFYSFNSIRYYVAVGLSLYACKFLYEKKVNRYLLVIIGAAFVHKSSLVCLLIHMFSLIKIPTKKRAVLIFGFYNLCGIALWATQSIVRRIIFMFYPSYEGSKYDSREISYLNIVICTVCILLLVLYYNKAKIEVKNFDFYHNMLCIGFMIYAYCYWIPEISRVGYYCMIAVPIILSDIICCEKERKKRQLLILFLGISFIAMFVFVMKHSYILPSPGLLPYRTIFSQ